jgi:cytochrome c1
MNDIAQNTSLPDEAFTALFDLKTEMSKLRRFEKSAAIKRKLWKLWLKEVNRADWFDAFVFEEKIDPREAYAPARETIAVKAIDLDPRFSLDAEYGKQLYKDYCSIRKSIEVTYDRKEELLELLWRAEVPIQQIADAYGASSYRSMYTIMKRKDWFETQTNKG